MSRIYFHHPGGETTVSGSERAFMGCVCYDLTIGLMDFTGFDLQNHAIQYLLPEDNDYYGKLGHFNSDRFVTSMAVHNQLNLRYAYDGEEPIEVSAWDIQLNTALALGSDPIKLCARLHGQCEVHAYVEGANRTWLADIMQNGRDKGILRENMGWEETIAMLRERDDQSVVTSYSVCDQFPNIDMMPQAWQDEVMKGHRDEDDPDRNILYSERDKLSRQEIWDMSMETLRLHNATGKLELTPDNWDVIMFGYGPHVLEIMNYARKVRHEITGRY